MQSGFPSYWLRKSKSCDAEEAAPLVTPAVPQDAFSHMVLELLSLNWCRCGSENHRVVRFKHRQKQYSIVSHHVSSCLITSCLDKSDVSASPVHCIGTSFGDLWKCRELLYHRGTFCLEMFPFDFGHYRTYRSSTNLSADLSIDEITFTSRYSYFSDSGITHDRLAYAFMADMVKVYVSKLLYLSQACLMGTAT